MKILGKQLRKIIREELIRTSRILKEDDSYLEQLLDENPAIFDLFMHNASVAYREIISKIDGNNIEPLIKKIVGQMRDTDLDLLTIGAHLIGTAGFQIFSVFEAAPEIEAALKAGLIADDENAKSALALMVINTYDRDPSIILRDYMKLDDVVVDEILSKMNDLDGLAQIIKAI